MNLTNQIKDAVHWFTNYSRIQMGIESPILLYYAWEEIEHFNYPIPDKQLYNKLLGYSDKINGNLVLLVNIRMHQSFNTVLRTIIHELMHFKFPKENDESRIEIFTNRWLETKHSDFGFFHDEKFFEGWNLQK